MRREKKKWRERNIEEKYDETSRTSTLVPIRYTEEESITASGELFHYLQDVSSPSAASPTETFYARLRLPRELWTAHIYIDGASPSTLPPRIFPPCRIGNITSRNVHRGRIRSRRARNQRESRRNDARLLSADKDQLIKYEGCFGISEVSLSRRTSADRLYEPSKLCAI